MFRGVLQLVCPSAGAAGSTDRATCQSSASEPPAAPRAARAEAGLPYLADFLTQPGTSRHRHIAGLRWGLCFKAGLTQTACQLMQANSHQGREEEQTGAKQCPLPSATA